ncbi:MAG: B12-binding domain-containing radical SAM protein [Bdellovibrionales bacterium]
MKVLFLNPQQEMGGIQCLSAFLKEAGHETALVNDPNLFDNPWIQYPAIAGLLEDSEFILQQIETYRPDLIALPVVTDDYKWALKWARRIKGRMTTPIVFGNVHPTFHPKDVLLQDCVDYVVRGEGEITLLELVETLEGKREAKDVLGLGFKENGVPRMNGMRPLIEDLDILPFPDKDLYYDAMPYLNHGYTTMSGRGCPYRCTFCDNNTSMKLYKEEVKKTQKWTRRHSPEYVINEILWAKERYGIEHVRFNDEDFSYDKKWLREFCALYIEKKVAIPYFAWVYPNTIDTEMAGLLAKSGCDAVEMGIQSGAEHLRKEILHRKTKDEDIINAMKALREAGVRTTVDVIIGLPTETKADLDATVRLLAAGRPWHLYAFWLRYYPSTEILSIAKERKLLSPEQIHKLESSEQSRGHIAGGTALEQDSLSRSYHAFIVLLPLMPVFMINFFVNRDLIRYFPSFLSPFLMVNLTKMIKRDKYNEFRVRGWLMLWVETNALLKRAAIRLFNSWRAKIGGGPQGRGKAKLTGVSPG